MINLDAMNDDELKNVATEHTNERYRAYARQALIARAARLDGRIVEATIAEDSMDRTYAKMTQQERW
jgi:hypothetical protein